MFTATAKEEARKRYIFAEQDRIRAGRNAWLLLFAIALGLAVMCCWVKWLNNPKPDPVSIVKPPVPQEELNGYLHLSCNPGWLSPGGAPRICEIKAAFAEEDKFTSKLQVNFAADEACIVRIFWNRPNADADTPITDRGYIGSFPVQARNKDWANRVLLLDVTERARGLLKAPAVYMLTTQVTLVPVPLEAK